jgi:hypothetical protein
VLHDGPRDRIYFGGHTLTTVKNVLLKNSFVQRRVASIRYSITSSAVVSPQSRRQLQATALAFGLS